MAYTYTTVRQPRVTLGRVGSTVLQQPSQFTAAGGGAATPSPANWFSSYQKANAAPTFTADAIPASLSAAGVAAPGVTGQAAPAAGGDAQAQAEALGWQPGQSGMGYVQFLASRGQGGGGGAGPAQAFQSPTIPAFNAPTSVTLGSGDVVQLGDYSNDPILRQTQAAVDQANQTAEADALASEKTNLIRYGDIGLAERALGGQLDQQTRDAITANKFATIPELGNWNQRALDAIDVARNSQNLFYGTQRATDRGLQQEDFLRQSATAGNTVQDALTNIARGLLQEKQQGQQQMLAAEEAAYQRALQLALTGYTPKTPTPAGPTPAGPTDGTGTGWPFEPMPPNPGGLVSAATASGNPQYVRPFPGTLGYY
jgi:hypothetical protein